MNRVVGLVELAGGWIFAVGSVGKRRVRMLVNFDPRHDRSFSSVAGSRTVLLSQLEADNLAEAIRTAATLHTTEV